MIERSAHNFWRLVSETGDGWDERKEKGGTRDTSWVSKSLLT